MKSVGVAVTAIALAISAPAFAAGQTIPLAAMTCKQFVDSPRDTIGVILTWMMGYLQDEDEPAELDFSKMENLGKKLGTYCGQNPAHGVMRALDKVSDADDDSDTLKSVVVYRARFFGHKFDLSGVLHVDFLPGETRLARAA